MFFLCSCHIYIHVTLADVSIKYGQSCKKWVWFTCKYVPVRQKLTFQSPLNTQIQIVFAAPAQRQTRGIRAFCLTKCSQSEIRIKTQELFSWRGCHLLVAWMVTHTWNTVFWECSDVCSTPPSPFGSLPFIVYSSLFKAKWEKERQRSAGRSLPAGLNIFLKSAS